MKTGVLAAVLSGALLLTGQSAFAGTIIINSDTSDPAPKKAITQAVEQFNKEHKDITAELNVYDHESYKASIRNWLSSEAPDVVFWYSGERMNSFVAKGLIEPISDVWEQNGLSDKMASTKPGVTFDGEQYGLPYTYYQWGVYYRKDLFEKYGIGVPETWEDFKAACATLKENGIAPITIGTKNLWPAAGWFDYMNLRVNGLDFHMKLMSGEIAYTDQRVKNTFAKWRELVDADYYIANHTSYSWQDAQPFFYQGKGAMYLIGNFIVPNFPEELKDSMGFFQFPVIDPAVKMYEDAPTDLLAIPAKAKNKEDAKKFLAFIARPEIIRLMNDALEQLPTHKDAGVTDNYYLNIGNKMLSESAGTAQFYDRDTKPEMAKIGMKGFQEFMAKPDRLDKILERIEKARKRIYKVK
ncbi:ABC transporter substrate-binding protein [Desulforhopalus sp. 52FAK]